MAEPLAPELVEATLKGWQLVRDDNGTVLPVRSTIKSRRRSRRPRRPSPSY